MFSINGIGTTLYGKSDVQPDGSYIATKWFIFILLPIIPLGSYRVRRGDTTSNGFMPVVGATTQYQMTPVALHWGQIATTLLEVYGVLALIALDFAFDPNLIFSIAALIIGSVFGVCYLIYHL